MGLRHNAIPVSLMVVMIVLLLLMVGAQYLVYRDAAEGCTGVVVKDYVGLPKCVESPAVAVPSRR